MSWRRRRLVLTLPLVLMLTGCGPAASSGPSSLTTATPTADPPATTTQPSVAPTTSPATGQSDTSWGRIWDTVPASFPVFPGATPADDARGEPASARFAVEGGDPLALATWLQDALEVATYSTLGFNGPGEDGGYLIDSTGDNACRIQTTVTPLGATTFVAVLYGAGCPAP